jgi:hypothetical protein
VRARNHGALVAGSETSNGSRLSAVGFCRSPGKEGTGRTQGEQLVLAHVVGWPTVALAVVLTVRRAIKNPGEWWRLIGGIGVLLAMLAATVIISLVVLGTQVPGFHLPDLTRTAAPAATASPQPAPTVAATPATTTSASHSGVYAGQGGRGAESAQQSGRAAAPSATRTPWVRSGSSAPRVRAVRDTGRRPRSGSWRDVRPLRSAPRWSITLRSWPRALFLPFRWYRPGRCRTGW